MESTNKQTPLLNKFKIKRSFFIYAILLFGVVLRLKLFLEGRDLFIDEINLVRNIFDLNYAHLFGSLQHEQHAPPLFLLLLKFTSELFGFSVYSLRLLPFLLSLSSLYVFYRLASYFFKDWTILYPLALFSFSIHFLEYGIFVKQYAGDIFCSTLLVYFALIIDWHNNKSVLLYALFGILSVWFSMPSIFVLAGIGFYMLSNLLKKEKNSLSLIPILVIGTLWVLSFLVLYVVNIQASIASDNLMDYHQRDFIPPPTSIESILKFKDLMISVFRSVVGKTTVPIIANILFFLTGLWILFKTKNNKAILLIAPFVFCIIASILGYYAFAVRLTLFMLPFIMILIGFGVQFYYNLIKPLKIKVQLLFLSFLIPLLSLSFLSNNGLKYLSKSYRQVETKKLINIISGETKTELPIYVSYNAVPFFVYYTEIDNQTIPVNSDNVIFGTYSSNLKDKLQPYKIKGKEQAWVFDAHSFGRDLKNINKQIQESGTIIRQHEAEEARLILIEF